MRTEDGGVAGGQNVDGVAGHGGDGVGGRQHHADDAPGRVLDEAEAGGIGKRFGAHRLRARHEADVAELDGLVVGAADFGFGQFDARQLVRVIVAQIGG